MLLHTVNKAPHQAPALRSCLRVLSEPASVLLIEDGVYAAMTGQEVLWETVPEQIKVYALQPDVLARGLADRLLPRVTLIDDAGFVSLCESHNKIQSWY